MPCKIAPSIGYFGKDYSVAYILFFGHDVAAEAFIEVLGRLIATQDPQARRSTSAIRQRLCDGRHEPSADA